MIDWPPNLVTELKLLDGLPQATAASDEPPAVVLRKDASTIRYWLVTAA
jgi:hypothetical protein